MLLACLCQPNRKAHTHTHTHRNLPTALARKNILKIRVDIYASCLVDDEESQEKSTAWDAKSATAVPCKQHPTNLADRKGTPRPTCPKKKQ